MSARTPAKPTTAPAAEERVAGLQPWHLFLIMTLLSTAAAAVATRDGRPASVIFVCLIVASAGLAAWCVYRTIRPLVEPDTVKPPEVLGGQTRAALEREKDLTLRAIEELEFDRAMGKVTDSDWEETTSRLRARAIRVAGQLESGRSAYRELIEREIKARTSAGRPGAPMLLVALLAGGLLASLPARAQMGGAPGGMMDARSMSGIPRLDPSLPAGTVSARLVRGTIGNVVVGSPVEFIVNGESKSATTDQGGHAVVSGLPAGATVRAVATLDGERLDSREFQLPSEGGMVVVLVGSDKAGAERTARSAVEGTVTLGGQSRVVAAFEDEELQVFYLFDIVNGAMQAVRTRDPLVFDLPSGAEGAALIEGAPATAVVKGAQVVVPGPFPPGVTSVQVAFTMPPSGSVAIRQKLPVAMDQVTVMVEKVGAVVLASPQLTTLQEGGNGGRLFVFGTGPGLPAGGVLAFDVKGLPHAPVWPRNTALAVGFLTLAAGAWGASRTRGRTAEAAARQQLDARREQLFGELQTLDRRARSGEIGGVAADERRRELMAELEQVYGELDTGAQAAPAGGERGV
jgi:hypothetical protein